MKPSVARAARTTPVLPDAPPAPPVLLALVAAVAAALLLLRIPTYWGAIQDDGFIYLRIAANMAHGHGPVFNAGERVDAATSPVWMWLLAVAARAGVSLPAAACALGLASWAAAVIWTARTAQHWGAPRGRLQAALTAAPALALVLDTRTVSYAFSGMETCFAALVWLWAAGELARTWLQGVPSRGAGAAVLAAALVRPEFVLFAFGFALVAWRRRTLALRPLLRSLVPALAGGVVYLAAHTAYFGDPLPNTYYAKRQLDAVHLQLGLTYLAALPRTYPWLFLAFGAAIWPRLRPLTAAWTVGLALYAAHVASLGGDHFEFQRPFIVVLPMALALTGAAAAQALQDARAAARAVAVAAVIALLGGAAAMRVRPGAFAWVRHAAQMGYALQHTYPPSTRVGMFAIGAAGYTSQLPVVDALGLADKHVARCDLSREHSCALDIGHERGDPAYVIEQSDVIVPWGTYAPARFESVDEMREGFYSHKKFLAAAAAAVADGRLRIRNIEFAPGAYWAVFERTAPRGGATP